LRSSARQRLGLSLRWRRIAAALFLHAAPQQAQTDVLAQRERAGPINCRVQLPEDVWLVVVTSWRGRGLRLRGRRQCDV
jgi:hypothetical protein